MCIDLLLFRCVLNWFGDWSTGALYQVGLEFTNKVDLDKSDVSLLNSSLPEIMVSFPSLQYIPPNVIPAVYPELPRPPSHRESIVNAFVYVHQTLHQANIRLMKRGGHSMCLKLSTST